MLPVTSWATLYRVFTGAMLFKKYYDNIEQDFSRVMLSGASWTALHKIITCALLSQEY